MGATEGDVALSALGVVRLAIPIPFTAAGGPVNVFLIDNPDGTLTLFDSGLGTPDAQESLVTGFAEAGRHLAEVRQIIVSHGHIDHYGAARFVVERSRATVFVHPLDRGKVVATGRWVENREVYKAYFLKLGVAAERVDRMAELAGSTELFAERLEEVEPLSEGQRFAFKHFEAEILHLPGHSPGLVCLHAPAHRLFFADDHILARVSPNPLIELGPGGEAEKFRALSVYFQSARRVRDLELDWILPGHGAPFKDHRAVLDGLFAFYERRQAKILEALAKGPRCPNDLVLDVFGRARTLELYLMLSEIVGNLEVLEEKGAVVRIPGSEPYLYRLA
jgi:glyoxylase-like metal-dependent hydrolase (beta-lactamase superfamily II)